MNPINVTCILAISAGCLIASGAATAANAHSSHALATPAVNVAAYRNEQLFRCRFEKPGRGERVLKPAASDPHIAACLGRAGAL
jgi:hypothetical protein